MNGAPNKTRTHSWRFASLACWPLYHQRCPPNKKEHLRPTRKFLETMICEKNSIKGINTRDVLRLRYSGPFLKWTREELRRIVQSIKQNKWRCIRPYPKRWRSEYVSRKEEGRGLAIIEDSTDASLRGMKNDINKQQRKTQQLKTARKA